MAIASHFGAWQVVRRVVPCDHLGSLLPREAFDRMIGSHPVVREEVLYHSDRSRVLRRQLDGTAGTIIVKELLGADAATRMHREVRILKRLRGVEGVSQLTAVDPRRNAIMRKDLHGVRLERILRTERLDVRSQILLILRLAQIVAAVHRRGIIHKGIEPVHIMLSGPERKPTLLHFELATSSAEPHSTFVAPRSIALTVHSDGPGTGATFTLELPLQTESESAAA